MCLSCKLDIRGRGSLATMALLVEQLAATRGFNLRGRPEKSAAGLFMLIDGLWNSFATGKDEFRPKQAINLCDVYREACLKSNHSN